MFDDYFVIFNEQDQPIGIDDSSGGYHYIPEYPGNIKFWSSPILAAKYIAVVHYNNPNHGWTIKRFNLTVKDVPNIDKILNQEWNKRNKS